MASTKLDRKSLRNRMRAIKRVDTIKRLQTVPTLKNIDVQEIKKSFAEAKN